MVDALWHAGKAGDVVEMTRLLDAGADPDAFVAKRYANETVVQSTALVDAASRGQLDAVRLLLDRGADPSLVDSDGFTPLMDAAGKGHAAAVVRELAARGADLDTAQPETGCTAFHFACYYDQPECAAALVDLGCNTAIRNKYEATGKQIAELKGHAAVLDVLRQVDWGSHQLVPSAFEKNFYMEHPDVHAMPAEECDAYRKKRNIHAISKGASKRGIMPNPVRTFDEASFPEYVTEELLKAGYTDPTAIQAQCWPLALSGIDMVGVARTGSGKTLAFLLPSIVHVNAQPYLEPGDGPIVLVIAPTRESACQIKVECDKFGFTSKIKNTCCCGGAPKSLQIRDLERGCEIVICTPGRMLDLLDGRKTNLRRVIYLVMDEVDRMLDMGFEPQVRKIVDQIRPDRQTLMWSATWSREVQSIANEFLTEFKEVHIGSSEVTESAPPAALTEVIEPQRQVDLKSELEPEPEPEPEPEVTMAEMEKWDADKVASWLVTTVQFVGAEIEAILNVQLDGEDLAEANERDLRKLCKKTTQLKPYEKLDWAKMWARIITARDMTLGMQNMDRISSDVTRMMDKVLGTNVWEGKMRDNTRCAVKLVNCVQGQLENKLLKRVSDAGRCEHIIHYLTGFEVSEDGRYFLAMELADRGSLEEWYSDEIRVRSLSWEQRKQYCQDLCSGLRFLHEKAGIVHRDLKPENILFKSSESRGGGRDVLKIADFGLSRTISESRSHRSTAVGAGTERWMPPEGLARSHGDFSELDKLRFRYDLHPAGSILFFTLSGGTHAFRGKSAHEIDTNIISGKHRTNFDDADDCVKLVTAMERKEALHVISRMLQKDPKQRGDIAAVLQHSFWMSATQKLDGVLKLCLQKKDLDALRKAPMPKDWTKQSTHWHLKCTELFHFKFYEGPRHGLDGIAKLIRNTHEHMLERDPQELSAAFHVEEPVTVDNKDAVLVKYLADRLPSIFLRLHQPTADGVSSM